MADEPDGAALLRQARRTLLEELLPALPERDRLNVLLIANAIGIGARELEYGGERAELPGAADLAAAIRQGRHDASADLYEALQEHCVARLRLSSPKALG